MNEFDEFLGIEVPDQWAEIIGRAETAGRPTVGRPRRRGSVSVLLGAVAVVGALLAGFLVLDRTPEDVVVSPVTKPVVTDPSADGPSTTSLPVTVPLSPSIQECVSETELREIGHLFRSGQPTRDYTPTRGVAELIEQSKVVVTGTITSVRRQQGGSETYTLFDVDDVEVLAGAGNVESFVTSSAWPVLDEPDPLGDPIELDGVGFVAFLVPFELNSAPGQWHPRVEGLAFGCAGLPAESLAGLPPDAQGLTVDEVSGLVGSSTESAGITRPVFPSDVCEATSARESSFPLTDNRTFFARPSKNPIAIQIVGTSETTPAEPFAWVQRSFGDDRDESELRVFDNGNGEASWNIGDGSQGYIRTRGLDEATVREIRDSLMPLPVDGDFPGFSVDSDVWESLHETMNSGLNSTGARSECQVTGVGPDLAGATLPYTVTAVSGDPVMLYAAVIDRLPPVDVDVTGQTVIIVSGAIDAAAPRAADVVDADPTVWQNLLGQSTSDEALLGVPVQSVREGDDVVVDLRNFTDVEVETSTLTLRVVVEDGVSFLEVDFTGVVLHPDAEFDSFMIDGRIRAESTVHAGSVGGIRISETSPADPFDVSVRITSTDGEVLQMTDIIRLVPQ